MPIPGHTENTPIRSVRLRDVDVPHAVDDLGFPHELQNLGVKVHVIPGTHFVLNAQSAVLESDQLQLQSTLKNLGEKTRIEVHSVEESWKWPLGRPFASTNSWDNHFHDYVSASLSHPEGACKPIIQNGELLPSPANG